ncbi:hypothetical protein C8J56DRAFT_891828 [Mycena floridula]|nr:hypothetical protein C8J56DRAFT_891828 [Mycena floridula]
MTLERALGGKGILDLTIWDEAIAMNVTKSYLDFGISWPHWADLADKIIANHCIKKPETNKDARINTFLQNWNTNLSSLPNLLQYMVGATEKYGFLFKDVRPSKQNCACEGCKKDRTVYNCSNPHNCAKLALQKLDSLLKKWDPRREEEEDLKRNSEPSRHQEEASPDKEVFTMEVSDSITELKEGFRVLTSYSEHNAVQSPAAKPPKRIQTDDRLTVYITSTTLEECQDNVRTGCGIVFDNFLTKSRAIRLPPQLPQTRYSGILTALLVTIQTTLNQIAKSLSTKLESWEDKGFIGMENRLTLQAIIARLWARTGETVLRLSAQCKDAENVNEAHNMADEGSTKRLTDAIDWSALAYKAITELQILPKDIARKTTAKNLKTIKQAITATNGSPPTTKDIWTSICKEAFTHRVKDYFFLMIHGTHRTGEYWKHIPGYKDRQICRHCGIEESMEHILVDSKESGQSTIWELARQILTARDPVWPKIDFGTIMGCGSIKIFSSGQKVDEGKTRLFQLIVSESAHLIWTTRCRIVVKEEAILTTAHIINLWTRAINECLAEDRRLTNP